MIVRLSQRLISLRWRLLGGGRSDSRDECANNGGQLGDGLGGEHNFLPWMVNDESVICAYRLFRLGRFRRICGFFRETFVYLLAMIAKKN